MRKEDFKFVDKVWGEEIWLVNNDKYCGKLLLVDQDAVTSYHCHKTKMETFYTIEGYGLLCVEGKIHTLAPFTRPKTIEPNERHSVKGLTNLIILEISTPHREDDVIRFKKSRAGKNAECI